MRTPAIWTALALLANGAIGCSRCATEPVLTKGHGEASAVLPAPPNARWKNAVVEYDVTTRVITANTGFGHLVNEAWVVSHDLVVRYPGGEARLQLEQRVDCCRTSVTLTDLMRQRYEVHPHASDPAAILVVRTDGKTGTAALRTPSAPVYCKHLPRSQQTWSSQGPSARDLLLDILGVKTLADSPPEHRPDAREFATDEGDAAFRAACAEPGDPDLALAAVDHQLLRARRLLEPLKTKRDPDRTGCLESAVRQHAPVRGLLEKVLRARAVASGERDSFIIAVRTLAAATDEASQITLAETTARALTSLEADGIEFSWTLMDELVIALARITETRGQAPRPTGDVLARISSSDHSQLSEARLRARAALDHVARKLLRQSKRPQPTQPLTSPP